MSSSYQPFTTTRTTPVDLRQLMADYHTQTNDQTMALGFPSPADFHHVTGKKATPWTPAQITGVQNAIDTGPALTLQRIAQAEIDAWPIAQKALALTLIDKINAIDANLAALLVAVNALNTKTSTPQTTLPQSVAQLTDGQALAAVRTKAGTL